MSRARALLAHWWPLVAPAATWALQGAAIWWLASLACPPPEGAGVLSDAAARVAIALCAAVALAVAAAALGVSLVRLRAAAPVTHAALAQDSRTAVIWAGAFVAVAFGVGVLYAAWPALVLGVCETVR